MPSASGLRSIRGAAADKYRPSRTDWTIGSPRILIVDDEAAVRELFRRALLLAGYDVVVASGGAEGLKMLASDSRIALVFLDLNMPQVDGWAFRRAQLSDPRLGTIPTVIVTGAVPETVKDAELRATAYLRKPLGPTQLIDAAVRHCPQVVEVDGQPL
jgi:CheY-like chemotaxis protein